MLETFANPYEESSVYVQEFRTVSKMSNKQYFVISLHYNECDCYLGESTRVCVINVVKNDVIPHSP